MLKAPYLIYLHGFLSSPQSEKAQQTATFWDQQGLSDAYTFPMMSGGPAETIAELCVLIDQLQDKNIVLMGSSLGGYYATYLAERFGLPAVLINPAVKPYELWEKHIGEHKNYYTDAIHTVTHEHIDELLEIDVESPSRLDDFLVLVQTGDETLDYRQAVEKFSPSRCWVREGGNHSFENYQAELPQILEYLLSRIDANVR
ncbi:MAG: YqiA/YcfP family alpha/beta fold hydrolase [Pseudohongiellaceae bacterium]